jgi:hypothetical protein
MRKGTRSIGNGKPEISEIFILKIIFVFTALEKTLLSMRRSATQAARRYTTASGVDSNLGKMRG